MTVGLAVPLITSRISGDDGLRFRTKSGQLSGFVLDSLRGLPEILQYGQGDKRQRDMDAQIDNLSRDEARMKKNGGKKSGCHEHDHPAV